MIEAINFQIIKKSLDINKASGIYKITSPSGRVYIGQSWNIRTRYGFYKNHNCKIQHKIYRSLLKYGFENHIFEIVEYIDKEFLNERERFWQDYYDVLETGLNCVLTASDKKLKVCTDEYIKNLKAGTLKYRKSVDRPIIQYDLLGNFIKEWKNVIYIREELGYCRKHITMACRIHEIRKRGNYSDTAQGFIWRNKGEIIEDVVLIRTLKIYKRLNTKIYQYDLNMNLIRIWNNMKELNEIGKVNKNVNHHLRGETKTYNNFIYKHERL